MPESTSSSNPLFSDLNLSEPLLRALKDVGYESPSPIQAATIPILLENRDVLGQAQTGTGKTAAFALPILSRIDIRQTTPQALVLASDLLQSIPPEPVDVLVANLYADLLLLVADDQKLSVILPHGTLIISGVAQTKRPMVEQALHAVGFRTLDERSEAWWNALVLNR